MLYFETYMKKQYFVIFMQQGYFLRPAIFQNSVKHLIVRFLCIYFYY